MRKQRTAPTRPKTILYVYLKDSDIIKYLETELSGPTFNSHVNETAGNLDLPVEIVKDILIDLAFQTIKKVQQSVLKRSKTKINLYGYLFLVTQVSVLKTRFVRIKKSKKL